MIDKVVTLILGKKAASGDAGGDAKSRITVAAAVLLLEMAKADGDFTLAERNAIRAMLGESRDLAADEIEGILAVAESEQESSVDLWAYTNLINGNYSEAEKIRLIEIIWDLAYADGRLDQYEDYLIHKLANLLHVKHPALIAAKLKALESRRHKK